MIIYLFAGKFIFEIFKKDIVLNFEDSSHKIFETMSVDDTVDIKRLKCDQNVITARSLPII